MTLLQPLTSIHPKTTKPNIQNAPMIHRWQLLEALAPCPYWFFNVLSYCQLYFISSLAQWSLFLQPFGPQRYIYVFHISAKKIRHCFKPRQKRQWSMDFRIHGLLLIHPSSAQISFPLWNRADGLSFSMINFPSFDHFIWWNYFFFLGCLQEYNIFFSVPKLKKTISQIDCSSPNHSSYEDSINRCCTNTHGGNK